MKNNIKIPFDESGNLIPVAGHWINVHSWRDNEVFTARLEFVKVNKGQYSDKYLFNDGFGRPFEMISRNFEKIVKLLDKGFIEGNFTYTKSHDTYGIKYVD